jgi:hypothetical protein
MLTLDNAQSTLRSPMIALFGKAYTDLRHAIAQAGPVLPWVAGGAPLTCGGARFEAQAACGDCLRTIQRGSRVRGSRPIESLPRLLRLAGATE